jgi:hypothetical protein
MQRGKKIDILIIDEKGSLLTRTGDFLVPSAKQRGNRCFLYALGDKLFTSADPEVVGSRKQRQSRSCVRNVIADEAMIVPIPTRLEEPSSDTPDVCEILGGCGRRRRAYVLFPI